MSMLMKVRLRVVQGKSTTATPQDCLCQEQNKGNCHRHLPSEGNRGPDTLTRSYPQGSLLPLWGPGYYQKVPQSGIALQLLPDSDSSGWQIQSQGEACWLSRGTWEHWGGFLKGAGAQVIFSLIPPIAWKKTNRNRKTHLINTWLKGWFIGGMFFDHYLEQDLLVTDGSTYLKLGRRILAQELVDPVDRALNSV